MARDYYAVLIRATAALDPNTGEARRAIYDRARVAIMDAQLPPAEIRDERTALEAAIERIEIELRPAAQRPAPPRHGQGGPPTTRDRPARGETRRSRPPRPVPFRPIVVLLGAGVLAVLIVAVISYAVWPRRSVTNEAAKRPVVSVAKVEATQPAAKSGNADASYILRRQLVYYRTVHPAGTIVIAKSQHYLYLVRPNMAALRYTIGVGRECTNAVGLLLVSAKEEGPESQPRLTVSATQPSDGPAEGANGGAGAHALALGDTGNRIYGTNPPVKSGEDGCFALANEDVADLYDRVAVGTRVVIN
jgi:lipoprotein-anchoring transpeptidase ErfK/SrfK